MPSSHMLGGERTACHHACHPTNSSPAPGESYRSDRLGLSYALPTSWEIGFHVRGSSFANVPLKLVEMPQKYRCIRAMCLQSQAHTSCDRGALRITRGGCGSRGAVDSSLYVWCAACVCSRSVAHNRRPNVSGGAWANRGATSSNFMKLK